MNVLLIGSGGREHALAWKICQSPRLKRLFIAPGNAGTAGLGQNLPIAAEDLPSLLQFCQDHPIDLVVIGPEAPLVAGLADLLRSRGLLVAGPSRAAAALEGSKAFAKDFMRRHHIPTASYAVFDDASTLEGELQSGRFSFPLVLKADGLAAGKGVFICQTLAEARQSLQAVMQERQFGAAGDRVVVEEFLEGEEASFMVFSDGENVVPMVPSQDHKAIFEGDRGPNTGGMGAYSIDSILNGGQRQTILEDIIRPAVQGMAAEGNPFRGILYAGLMLTEKGPSVLEFNARFGDPETQVILPRLATDLLDIFEALARGALGQISAAWHDSATVCVVLAAEGYPGSYRKGQPIEGLEQLEADALLFHAGTTLQAGRVVTSGGRVLGVTSQAPNLESAVRRAYDTVDKIRFDGMYYRRDIAAKGLRRGSH